MTLPRPVLLALLGLALCAAAFLATRSANDTGSAVTSVTPTPQSTPATKHPAAAKPPQPAHATKPHRVAPVQQKQSAKPHAAVPATPTKPQTTTKPATPAKPPVSPELAKTLPVIKALARGDVVVFFFTHPGPADDTGAAIAVRGLKQEKHVKVFTVGLNDLETYRPVLAGAGVSQVPAIVVVKAGHKARLLQGFVDARTLRQTVADARR
jgi:hypothetical protein